MKGEIATARFKFEWRYANRSPAAWVTVGHISRYMYAAYLASYPGSLQESLYIGASPWNTTFALRPL